MMNFVTSDVKKKKIIILSDLLWKISFVVVSMAGKFILT